MEDYSDVFIVGIQRSGTNFARFNCFPGSVDVCDDYHKHCIKNEDVSCEKVFCIVKNPYMWIESICFRNCVDIITYFPDYHLYDEKNYLGPFKINLVRLLHLYKDFYTSWINYEKTRIIQYEKLLVENSSKINHLVPESTNWNKRRIKNYLNYNTTLLSDDNIKTITNVLGHDFITKIGYPVK